MQNMEYQLLDSGNFQKLEQVGPYRLVRPALNAFWLPSLAPAEWQRADGVFTRSSDGGGSWRWHLSPPESWNIILDAMTLLVKPTGFGHLGFFAEQHETWNWLRAIIPTLQNEVSILNLFGYSGVGSLAMAEAGARVTHLDAAAGMTEWGRQILKLNPQVPDNIRWIVDDVRKFVEREVRRQRQYNGIVLDPPTFGRGNKGQVWKIEQHLVPLLEKCSSLLDNNRTHFVVLSCHSPGFSPLVLQRLVEQVFDGGECESGEMIINETSGRQLPAGSYVRWLKTVH